MISVSRSDTRAAGGAVWGCRSMSVLAVPLGCTDGCTTKRHRAGKIGAVDLVAAQHNLRYLLNEWDPIGVADLVADEYDCMIAPLLSKLSAGAGRAEISEFLWYELEDHIGLDPAPRNVDAMADRLVAWWASAGDLS